MENNVGGNIARERHNQNMTQEQLAELSDLTINYLSKIERGFTKNVSTNTLSKISKALGVTMDSLVYGKDIKSSEKLGPNLRQLVKFLNSLESEQSEQLSKRLLEVIKLSQKTNNN
ncbi:helix-turn-helix domain-containing protein [Companilactobacillus zhachilii]|jgi:Predicted transcriptional regulators|uniref:helix-turn-helix domain-containing protein n=1 Tax=Companilactobacillus zhachilii TaxID=2304606 RepID=UPI0019228A52|nr:helix-turn-helix transcriptional regulator [Companilactobacillus zhachilii]MBL3531688.1 helix-turn-helix transcriptional regulator [Companilactobacillus zhachilii]